MKLNTRTIKKEDLTAVKWTIEDCSNGYGYDVYGSVTITLELIVVADECLLTRPKFWPLSHVRDGMETLFDNSIINKK